MSTSKQLTASVRLNTTQFETKLRSISNRINALNNTVGKNNRTYEAVNSALSKADANTKEVTNSTKRWGDALKSNKSILGSLGSKLKTIAKTLISLETIKIAVKGADELTGAENRLNNIAARTLGGSAYTYGSYGNVNGYSASAMKFTEDAMSKMYNAAQSARTSYSDMLSNVSKTMTLAPDAFKGNIDNAIRFQEIMAKAYTVGGASAQEMSTSMYQLTQALGAGILAGDELRSVREGAPLAYQAIEKFAQGVYNTSESLKDLAADGKITSEMVVAAIMNEGDALDQAFALTKYRFSEVWTQIKNAGQRAFQPVITMLTDMLNKAVDDGLVQKVEKIFMNIAKFLMIVMKVVQNVANYIVDNWNWLKHIIIGGLSILISYFIITKTVAIASAIATAIAWMIANWQIVLLILAIGLLIYAIIMFKNGTIDCCTAIGIALLAVAAICFLIFGWQVALVFAIIALVVFFFDYVCAILATLVAVIWDIVLACAEVIAGIVVWLVGAIIDILSFLWNVILWIVQVIVSSVVWLGSTILNIIIGCINGCLQAVWSFIDPFLSIIEFILNCCNGGFNTFGDAVANLIGQIISWFLSLGKVVTKIIDAIFGTNWTDGLNALQDKVLAWGKNEKGITISREAPEIKRIDASYAAGATWDFLDGAHSGYVDPGAWLDSTWNWMDGAYVSPTKWGNAAFDWGSGVMDAVNNWGSKFQKDNGNKNNGSSWLDNLGEKLGLDFTDVFGGDGTNGSIGNYDPSDALGALNNIDDTTGNIADSMDLTEEDLEYLRKIAEMEWKKEYTTAEIKVEMTNNNTVDKDFDLHSLAIGLRDLVEEEMFAVANGVYA